MELETVERIVEILGAHAVSEITLEQDGLRIVAKKPLAPVAASAAQPAAPAAGLGDPREDALLVAEILPDETAPEPALVTAGLVGLFRHAEPPVGYGAMVVPGQLVGSIEAMKVLNDVRADADGQIIDVLIEEGAPVEYGQPLFRVMGA